ncbi:hypothetical protein Hamer_G016599, partial [Homarus americanus]
VQSDARSSSSECHRQTNDFRDAAQRTLDFSLSLQQRPSTLLEESGWMVGQDPQQGSYWRSPSLTRRRNYSVTPCDPVYSIALTLCTP